MSTLADLLEEAAGPITPRFGQQDVRERVRRRRSARRRNRALAAAVLVLVAIPIALSAGRSPTTTVHTVSPASRERIALTRAHPQFGPSVATAEIVLINADGTDEVQLTHAATDGRLASQPAWSPDRRRLAFIDSTPASAVNAGTGDLTLINADGTNPVRLTHGTTDIGPAWAPDGHHLAFARFGDGGPDIYVIGDDGSGLTRLTTTKAMSPTWSPDGTRLAFRNLPNGLPDGGHIFTMNADGTGITQLTHGTEEYGPAWSPDGTRIVFGDSRDSSLYSVRPDGTDPIRLTTCGPGSCTADTGPGWSPDGTRIVFTRSDGNKRHPYIVDTATLALRPITTDNADDCCPAW